MTATDHGPGCIACNNSAEARRLIAEERARLNVETQRVAEHRQTGENARRDYLTPGIGDADLAEAQNWMLYHLGTANAIAQDVIMRRAHLDRVEAAHPALTGDAVKPEQLALGGAA